jgi:hypothetical protein
MLRRLILLSLVVTALAIPAAPAVAASTTDGYATPAGVSQTQVSDGPTGNDATTATRTTSGSTLPFTGLDLGLMLAGGVVLLGGGLVLKRFTRRLPERP